VTGLIWILSKFVEATGISFGVAARRDEPRNTDEKSERRRRLRREFTVEKSVLAGKKHLSRWYFIEHTKNLIHEVDCIIPE
jgi:hypothetical protein